MCEPTTIALSAMAVSGGIQAYGQKKAGDYNARVANVNAELAEESAQDALRRGASEASRYRVQAKQFQGGQRTAVAANNIEASGSALRILSDSAAISEMDIATIRSNAAREAFGFRTQGLNYRAQGRLDKFSGRTRAAGTILGTAAQSYGFYQQFG